MRFRSDHDAHRAAAAVRDQADRLVPPTAADTARRWRRYRARRAGLLAGAGAILIGVGVVLVGSVADPETVATSPVEVVGPQPATWTGTYAAVIDETHPVEGCPTASWTLRFSIDAHDGMTWTGRLVECREPGVEPRATVTAVLEAPDGSRLEGSVERLGYAARPGAHHEITLTRGTGALTGTRGTCAFTIGTAGASSSRRYESGEVTCTLDP